MGKTYAEMRAQLEAQYNEIWARADMEYELDGTISQATMDKIASIELDMQLMGI